MFDISYFTICELICTKMNKNMSKGSQHIMITNSSNHLKMAHINLNHIAWAGIAGSLMFIIAFES